MKKYIRMDNKDIGQEEINLINGNLYFRDEIEEFF